MVHEAMPDITELLIEWSHGDSRALDRLLPLVYGDLRRIARGHLRKERPDHTLQATALVHEAYIRLVDQKRVEWKGRTHFFCVAAMAMRRVLVDHARSYRYDKRRVHRNLRPLEDAVTLAAENPIDMVVLDDALTRLESLDAQKSRVVELRFFGGLTASDAARVLGVSQRTVERDWEFARAWLARELGG